VSKRRTCCRVEQTDPLARLLDLLALAEHIEAELYALPCAREAAIEPCRFERTEPAEDSQVCGNGPLNRWCSTCRAWWLQSRVSAHLAACVRLARRAPPALEIQSHPADCDCGRCIDLSGIPTSLD
jgi:hypothetical protein